MFQLKMKNKVRTKIVDAWCVAPKSHTSGSWLTKEEGSFPEQMCWIRFLREYVTTWAWAPISWLPSGSKWGEVLLFNISTCKGFLQCFLVLSLMWHNEGLYLWVIQSPFAGISPVRAFTLLSVHLLERRNYTQIRRTGVKGLLLMYSYFGSTSSFQRRGNWCVKINCGHKKTICQTGYWFSLIYLTFLSMFHEGAGISQLDKRCQTPGMEAVQQVGLPWASMVYDNISPCPRVASAQGPHQMPVIPSQGARQSVPCRVATVQPSGPIPSTA